MVVQEISSWCLVLSLQRKNETGFVQFFFFSSEEQSSPLLSGWTTPVQETLTAAMSPLRDAHPDH